MGQDFNKTVNLPQTEFPMRAALPKREPDMLQGWYDMDLYHKMYQRNQGKPAFVLHDGPPFSNGYIHMGTALNKCLKDFINRYKSMSGYQVTYTPGWDNHGMPIESAIIKQQKLNRKAMSIPEFRDACHDFAMDFVGKQMAQFKRLGVLGEWEKPYLTMNPAFEAEEVKIFGRMYQKGYIYKGLKPVYWCAKDETALAEAEIEYQDDPCTTVYVKFAMHDDLGKLSHLDTRKLFFVIWTTTIWTLPGNMAIALNPRERYAVIKPDYSDEMYIMAEALAEKVMGLGGFTGYRIVETHEGAFFENMLACHPFLPKTSRLVLADYVTMDSGTGCVHTAPGFGADDYQTCMRYGMDIIVPVDDRGRHTDYAGKYAGMTTEESNPVILADMRESGALFAAEDIIHSYPHCWRCKSPIVYRATDQWFCSVDAFKDDACQAADKVIWLPDWGHDRMVSMIRERADWCISRQRHWGLPIPVFYCGDCGKPVCTPETIETVSAVFAREGSNAWFAREPEELLPTNFVCPHCGGTHFTKETDTLDGWFDSGSTHIASMELDAPGTWPADLYLEGGDQYRGWFQSSLLIGTAIKGSAPYRTVLTHGWTVDGEGRAMHKSLGNSVAPDELIPKYGAELVRLWAASADYHLDMRCSDNIFKQLSDTYLKIRNTCRYILGNLAGFDPAQALDYADMLPLDQWALSRLNDLVARCLEGYESYAFHSVIHAVHNFCVVDMSSFYLDVIKDRLYCDSRTGRSRLSAQTAIFRILDAMTRLLAPVLAFTSNEVWLDMPHAAEDDPTHVMLNDMPAVNAAWQPDETASLYWERVLALRADVNKALELARAEKLVGKPLDAKVTLYVSEAARAAFSGLDVGELPGLFIVSEVEVVSGTGEGWAGESFPGITVKVDPSQAPKCPRCWTHSFFIGEDTEYPELCPRCAAALKEN